MIEYKNGEYRFSVHLYLYDPKTMKTTQDVIQKDKWVEMDIKRLEEALGSLKEYRLELMNRFNYLSTSEPTKVITLKRERNYRDFHVNYHLFLLETFPDGTTRETGISDFTGKERSQAIKAFKQYCKDHPSLESVMDIEKGRWEK